MSVDGQRTRWLGRRDECEITVPLRTCPRARAVSRARHWARSCEHCCAAACRAPTSSPTRGTRPRSSRSIGVCESALKVCNAHRWRGTSVCWMYVGGSDRNSRRATLGSPGWALQYIYSTSDTGKGHAPGMTHELTHLVDGALCDVMADPRGRVISRSLAVGV